MAGSGSSTTAWLGFLAAVATAVLSAIALTIGFVTPVRGGPFCPSDCITYPYVDVGAYFPTDYVWILPAFLLVPTFLVLMACIHAYAADDRKLFGLLGLSFAVVYAAVIATDYFVQVVVIVPSVRAGETEGLSVFTMYDPHGLFLALEGLGYLFMAAAFLWAAPIFGGGRLERSIRWIFVAGFVAAISMFVGLSIGGADIIAFEVAIISIDWTVLIVTGALIALVFRRALRRARSTESPPPPPSDAGSERDLT